jgi:hypothetical protein
MRHGKPCALLLLCVLAGCSAGEQQLQAAREQVWATYGGKDGAACMERGAPMAQTYPSQFRPPIGGSRGSLKKRVIRKVIQHHIGEIRSCFVSSLLGWPDLAGRVAVKFIIQPDGNVGPLAVADTTLNNRAVECCILAAVRSWQFPAPEGGGIIVVTYPFVLEQR